MIEILKTSGYRLLDQDFKADFGRLTVVIGANASGKSTLLDCLQFISQSMDWPLRQVIDLHGGFASVVTSSEKPAAIKWEITFTKPIQNPVWSKIPLEDAKSFTYEVL